MATSSCEAAGRLTTRSRWSRRGTASSYALSGAPSDPVPELRVAAGVLTTLVFDAPLDRGSVELEGRERFRLVDAGDRSLVLEPAVDLGPGERLGLRVLFAGSSSQTQGSFVLVTHGAEVDTRVEVFRRKDSVELLHAELADMRAQLNAQAEELQMLRALRDSSGPSGLFMSGMLDHRGVIAGRILAGAKRASGESLTLVDGTSFRASNWAIIGVAVRNDGKKPWVPGTARIVSARGGTEVGVLAVRSSLPRISPGESGLVLVETEVPSWKPGEVCVLELLDGEGASQMTIPQMTF
ncbi:DUF2381 family protein [Myxococcus sp. 1LA]